MASVWTLVTIFVIAALSISIFTLLLIYPISHGLYPGTYIDPETALLKSHSGAHESHGLHWGYGVLKTIKELLPKDWGRQYADCDGNHQSPVDFSTQNLIHNSLLTEVKFINYDTTPVNGVWTATNNGHTVQFTANFDVAPQIAGGGLENGTYYFRQFHYHWGSNNTYGSEHAVDGKTYPIEIHLVHVRDANDSSPYKVVVVGIFAEVSDSDAEHAAEISEEIRAIVAAAQKVSRPGMTKQVRVPGFSLARFIPADPQYFRYYGSLTTPPCSQHLQWTVMRTPIKLSRHQMKIFRELVATSHPSSDAHEYIRENFRPIQSSERRIINYFSGSGNDAT